MARRSILESLPVQGRLALVLLAVFTVFLTWRAKALELGGLTEGPENRWRGQEAPAFSLAALDGRTVSLADFRGKKKVVVAFWASWCAPCRMELPALQALYKEAHRESSDFEFVAISTDDEKGPVEEYVTEEQISFPVLLDAAHQATEAYEVSAIPYLLVIDTNGKVIYEHRGYSGALEFALRGELGLNRAGVPGANQGGQPSH